MSPQVVHRIVKAIHDISFGSVMLVIQDGKLIQMEKLEKICFADEKEVLLSAKPDSLGVIESRVNGCLFGLKHGCVVINVRGGSIAQIDRTEKCLTSLQVVDGKGT